MRRFLGTSLFALIAGCHEPEASLTQVIVLVGGDPEIRALDVRVLDVEGATTSSARSFDLALRASGRLPTSFTIVPDSGNRAGKFRLVIEGRASDESGNVRELSRTEVVAAFSPGLTTVLPIVLSPSCAGERCGCKNGERCPRVCRVDPVNLTLTSCVPLPVYDELPTLRPGVELDVIARGLGQCEPGAFPNPQGRCEDVDECAFFVDTCSVTPRSCVNRLPEDGRYRCKCPSGHRGSGEADDPCLPCDGGLCDDAGLGANSP